MRNIYFVSSILNVYEGEKAMINFKTFVAMVTATCLFSMTSIVPASASAEELDTEFTETIQSDYTIVGNAIHGTGNVWYVDKSGNIFTETWTQYWNYDGRAGVGEISYNDSWETDSIRVLHNDATHSGYVQNRSTMTGAWTNDASSGEWTNTASINHQSGTIRWWLYN